jgi:hypothetical protein
MRDQRDADDLAALDRLEQLERELHERRRQLITSPPPSPNVG